MSMLDLSHAVIVNKLTGKRFAVSNDADVSALMDEINQWYKDSNMPEGGIFNDIETIAVGLNGEWYILDECGHHEILDSKLYNAETD